MFHNRKAVIYGCTGTSLTDAEAQFFADEKPIGFILFQRNCQSPDQIRTLIAEVKSAVGSEQLFTLIDQEGGKVARLKPPTWPAFPPAEVFAKLYNDNPADAIEATRINHQLIGYELHQLGINTDCAPVLDHFIDGMHDIIGNRAFGDNATQIAELGRAACDGLLQSGVLPVIKHIPGHGRATVDSHESLPIVTADKETIDREATPFKALSDSPFAMTAHITYTALDAEQCATLSPTVIDYIRNDIGFDNALMTDDLSMKALDGDFASRTEQSYKAGCDIALHCNGDMNEMTAIASASRDVSDACNARLTRAWTLINSEINADKQVLTQRLLQLLPNHP